MKDLESESYSDIAVFAHTGWIRAFLDIVVGTRMPHKNLICDNCAIGIFDFNGKIWRLHSWINAL